MCITATNKMLYSLGYCCIFVASSYSFVASSYIATLQVVASSYTYVASSYIATLQVLQARRHSSNFVASSYLEVLQARKTTSWLLQSKTQYTLAHSSTLVTSMQHQIIVLGLYKNIHTISVCRSQKYVLPANSCVSRNRQQKR